MYQELPGDPGLSVSELRVRALACRAQRSLCVAESLEAPVCSSNQLNMLSCRDGAMQPCQQAPISNEFSTAVLSCSEGGESYSFSVIDAPQDPSWSLFVERSSAWFDRRPSVIQLVLLVS